MGCAGSAATAQAQEGDQLTKKKIFPGQSAVICNCPNAKLNGESTIDGTWNKATIKGNILQWATGEQVTIDVVSPKQLRMTYQGETYNATLQENGKLHWSDGDVWHRTQAVSGLAEISVEGAGKELVNGKYRCHGLQNGRHTFKKVDGTTTIVFLGGMWMISSATEGVWWYEIEDDMGMPPVGKWRTVGGLSEADPAPCVFLSHQACASVGDRVEILCTDRVDQEDGKSYGVPGSRGMYGTVIAVDESDVPFHIKLDNNKDGWYEKTWIKVVQTKANKAVVAHTTADVQQLTRTIQIYFASGGSVELAVSPGDTVGDLCRRVADLRDAGWATLLVGSEALDETLDVCSIPEGDGISAVLSNSIERPDRLKKTLREQIQKSCEINLHGEEDLEEAFKQTSWKKFCQFCQPVQDFTLTLFECAGEKFIDINYGLGDNDYGTLHREGVVDPIMVNTDGDWEPKVEAWKDVHHAFCDQCKKTIIGTRHQSLELEDYDLCEVCFKSEDRKPEAWEQPEPPPQLSVAEMQDEEDEDEDEEVEYDDDDYTYRDLEPFFLAVLKAKKTNCIEKHGS